MQGVLLSLLVVAVFLAVSALREYMLRHEAEQQLHRQPMHNQQHNPHLDDPVANDGFHDHHQPAAAVEDMARQEAAEERQVVQEANRGIMGWDRRDDIADDIIEAEGEDVMLGFFDGREEEVPLDEFVGLRGPFRVMLENALTALVSNGLFIGILTLIPFNLGRIVLWLKHNWHLVLVMDEREGMPAYYSDAVNLLVGYCTLVFLTLVVVVSSLLMGGGGPWLAPQSLFMRQVHTIVRYGLILGKVGLLLAVELVAFPMGCGWWLDMCSLHLVDARAEQRFAFLRSNFFTSHFLHWLVGVAFMLHVSVFVAVLREVVRPEILWFLRNPADAEDHPLRDLIDEPFPKHARRIVLSSLLYIPLTVGFIYVPVAIARACSPDLFPLRGTLHDPFAEVPAPLLLLQVSLPLAMEHLRPRDSFKTLLQWWLEGAGQYTGLRDKIIPTPVVHLVPSHQHHSNGDEARQEDGSEEHKEDAEGGRMWVAGRAAVIIVMGWCSLAVIGAACIVLPVSAGRAVLSACGLDVRQDVYAFSIGFFLVGVGVECLGKVGGILQSQGPANLLHSLFCFSTIAGKCGVAGTTTLVLLPLMTGLLLDLTLGVPLRVGLHQTPARSPLDHWLVGILSLKLCYRLMLLHPTRLPLHDVVAEAAANGWRQLRLRWLLQQLALPLLAAAGALLALPYTLVWGTLPLAGVSPATCACVHRWVYPAGAAAWLVWLVWVRVGRVVRRLHDALRDSLYLVGRQLHNIS